jgi:hypothetical protein
MNIKTPTTVFSHAFVGWVLCGATIGFGMATMSMQNTLIIHAIAAPIYFALISVIYFTKFNYTTPGKRQWPF